MTILNEQYDAIHADGTLIRITVTLTAPVEKLHENGNDWCCTLTLLPFFVEQQPIYGISALQSLSIAVSLIKRTLTGFQTMGGKILAEDGTALGPVSEWLEIQQ